MKPNERVAYTRKQLQVVQEDEEDPHPQTIRTPNSKNEFAIKKLIDKRTSGNRTEYKVLWKGHPASEATWQFKSKIPKSFVDKYEASNHQ